MLPKASECSVCFERITPRETFYVPEAVTGSKTKHSPYCAKCVREVLSDAISLCRDDDVREDTKVDDETDCPSGWSHPGNTHDDCRE